MLSPDLRLQSLLVFSAQSFQTWVKIPDSGLGIHFRCTNEHFREGKPYMPTLNGELVTPFWEMTPYKVEVISSLGDYSYEVLLSHTGKTKAEQSKLKSPTYLWSMGLCPALKPGRIVINNWLLKGLEQKDLDKRFSKNTSQVQCRSPRHPWNKFCELAGALFLGQMYKQMTCLLIISFLHQPHCAK